VPAGRVRDALKKETPRGRRAIDDQRARDVDSPE
jgi:hypothetical protein